MHSHGSGPRVCDLRETVFRFRWTRFFPTALASLLGLLTLDSPSVRMRLSVAPSFLYPAFSCNLIPSRVGQAWGLIWFHPPLTRASSYLFTRCHGVGPGDGSTQKIIQIPCLPSLSHSSFLLDSRTRAAHLRDGEVHPER
ncbi:hypothetical protein B0H12DRAFT_713614 [Mycena haematopus]|nr:hypothetical protein B0H12DRAFT_713614 [Mycena haematopus]